MFVDSAVLGYYRHLNPNMRSSFAFFTLLISSLSLIVADSTLIRHSSARADASAEQSAFDKREAAYRANNLGVAFLEQYKTKEAVASFTQALEIKPDLLIARINLSITLYYLPDIDRAKREAAKALTQDPNAPQPEVVAFTIKCSYTHNKLPQTSNPSPAAGNATNNVAARN